MQHSLGIMFYLKFSFIEPISVQKSKECYLKVQNVTKGHQVSLYLLKMNLGPLGLGRGSEIFLYFWIGGLLNF